jgi:crossover junction endodeoxyribonuclease RusA
MLASDEWDTATGAVGVEVTFRLARPLDHYGTGRNARQLKTWAPTYCTSQHNGDGDKLERATYDALTVAGVIKDDSLIVAGHWLKRYANHGEQAGATIEVYTVHDAPILDPYRYGQAVTS